MTLIWIVTVVSLATGFAQIYLPLTESTPVKWIYWHSRFRKLLIWLLLIIGLVLAYQQYLHTGLWLILLAPICIQLFTVIITYRLHQEVVFDAIFFPSFTADYANIPITDEMEVALIEVNNTTHAYPLKWVELHHIINDRIEDKTISLTYCAMCRSIIAFDVTDIGPLYVASFKNSNMIVADKNTRTFFQQATQRSIIGSLHPHELIMFPYQIMPWSEARSLQPPPQIAIVKHSDLRDFSLPIPGVWQKIINSEATPGLSARNRDKRFSARTRVIGIQLQEEDIVYIKQEVLSHGIIHNSKHAISLVAWGNTISVYKTLLNGKQIKVEKNENRLIDTENGYQWNIKGQPLTTATPPLEIIHSSDEFWFSWARFHPDTVVMRS